MAAEKTDEGRIELKIKLDVDDARSLADDLRRAARESNRTSGAYYAGWKDEHGNRVTFQIWKSNHDRRLEWVKAGKRRR